MKYFLALLGGLLLGAAAGLGALYFNPFSERAASPLGDANLEFAYALPHGDLLAFTHSSRLPLPFVPEGLGPLWESTISTSAVAVISLEAKDGKPKALATRLSTPSRETDPLLRGALLDDYWLVTVPGEGSLFVHSANNLWPFLMDTVLPVSVLGRPWHGPRNYRPTLGPDAARRGVIMGGTGRFAHDRGVAAERYTLKRYSRAQGPEDVEGELALRVEPPSDTSKPSAPSAPDAPQRPPESAPASAPASPPAAAGN